MKEKEKRAQGNLGKETEKHRERKGDERDLVYSTRMKCYESHIVANTTLLQNSHEKRNEGGV